MVPHGGASLRNKRFKKGEKKHYGKCRGKDPFAQIRTGISETRRTPPNLLSSDCSQEQIKAVFRVSSGTKDINLAKHQRDGNLFLSDM